MVFPELTKWVYSEINGSWPSYLETMKSDHILGDHITLYAATKVSGVHFLVLSSSGADATVFVSEKFVRQCVDDTNIMVLVLLKLILNSLRNIMFVCHCQLV